MPDKIENLYKNLVGSGNFDEGYFGTLDQFRTNISKSPESREKLYNNLNNSGNFEQGYFGTLEQFESNIVESIGVETNNVPTSNTTMQDGLLISSGLADEKTAKMNKINSEQGKFVDYASMNLNAPADIGSLLSDELDQINVEDETDPVKIAEQQRFNAIEGTKFAITKNADLLDFQLSNLDPSIPVSPDDVITAYDEFQKVAAPQAYEEFMEKADAGKLTPEDVANREKQATESMMHLTGFTISEFMKGFSEEEMDEYYDFPLKVQRLKDINEGLKTGSQKEREQFQIATQKEAESLRADIEANYEKYTTDPRFQKMEELKQRYARLIEYSNEFEARNPEFIDQHIAKIAEQERIDKEYNDSNWISKGWIQAREGMNQAINETVASILSLPKITSDLIGVKGYGLTDELFDFAAEEARNIIPSQLDASTFERVADVDGYKVILDVSGNVQSVRNEDNSLLFDENLESSIAEKYSNNKDDYEIKEGQANWDNILHKISYVSSGVVRDMAGAKILGAPLSKLTTAERANRIGLFSSTAVAQMQSSYINAKNAGASDQLAASFAFGNGVIAGSTALINPQFETFGLERARNPLKFLNRTKLTKVKEIGKAAATGTTKETLEELTQEKGEILLKTAFNEVGNTSFDTRHDINTTLETIFLSSVIGAAGGAVGQIRGSKGQTGIKVSDRSRLDKESLYKAYLSGNDFMNLIKDYEGSSVAIDGKVQELTPELSNEIQNQFVEVSNRVDNLTKRTDLNDEQTLQLVSLVDTKVKLEQELGEADPILEEGIKNEILEVDQDIAKILAPEKEIVIPEEEQDIKETEKQKEVDVKKEEPTKEAVVEDVKDEVKQPEQKEAIESKEDQVLTQDDKQPKKTQERDEKRDVKDKSFSQRIKETQQFIKEKRAESFKSDFSSGLVQKLSPDDDSGKFKLGTPKERDRVRQAFHEEIKKFNDASGINLKLSTPLSNVIKNIKGQASLDRAVDYVNKLMTDAKFAEDQRVIADSRKKILNETKPSKYTTTKGISQFGGVKVKKATAEGFKVIKAANKALKSSDIDASIKEIQDISNSPEFDPMGKDADMLRALNLYKFNDPTSGLTVEDAQNALDWVNEFTKNEKAIRKEINKKKAERLNTIKEDINKDRTNYGKLGTEKLSKRQELGRFLATGLDKFTLQDSFISLMDKLSNDSKADIGKGFLPTYVKGLVNEGINKKQEFLTTVGDLHKGIVEKNFPEGIQNAGLNEVIESNIPIRRTVFDEKGKATEEGLLVVEGNELTKSKLMDYYAKTFQPTLYDDLVDQGVMTYDNDADEYSISDDGKKLFAKLKPNEKKYAEALVDVIYPAAFDKVNPVHREVNFTDIRRVDGFTPKTVVDFKEEDINLLEVKNPASSINNANLTERKGGGVMQATDINQVLYSYVNRMSDYFGYVKPVGEISKTIINNKDFKKSLVSQYGQKDADKMMNIIESQVKSLYSNPFKDKSMIFDQMRKYNRRAVFASLAFKLGPAAKQTVSILTFIEHMGYTGYADQVRKAYKDIPGFKRDLNKLMNEPYIVRRLKGNNFNENLADSMVENMLIGASTERKIYDAGFYLNKKVDAFTVMRGGALTYRYYKDQGYSDQAAMQEAISSIDDSQQSAEKAALSLAQKNPAASLFLAYKNSNVAFWRKSQQAATNILKGKGDQQKNWRTLMLYRFVLPSAWSAATSAIGGAAQLTASAFGFGDQPEPEEYWDKFLDAQIRALALGNINSIFIIGDALTWLWDAEVEDKHFEFEPSPIIGAVKDVPESVKDVYKKFDQPKGEWDDIEDYVNTTGAVGEVLKTLVPFPTGVIKDVDKFLNGYEKKSKKKKSGFSDF